MDIKDFLLLENFNDFKNVGNRLIDIDDLPQWFWDKAVTPPIYVMIPDYCKLVNDYRMRYVEVKFEDDVVGFVFKVVQIMNTKQIRLFEVPFSLNDNNKNIKLIIAHLYDKLQNNLIILSNDFDCGVEYKEYNNYYYNYLFYQQLETNKYRRKHQYKYYESNFKLEIHTELNQELQEQFAKIHDVWATIKENVQSLNSFNYAITKSHKSQNYIYYIGYLNDIPCVCGICIITKFGLYGVFRYSLIKTDPIYRCVNIHTSKLLSQYAYNNMSILNIYNLGARKNENGVINFKENTSAGKVISYKLNIDELLKV